MQFELATVTQFAAHQDNKRLIGFVVHLHETPGEESMSAYVFESNTEGEKVCIMFVKILNFCVTLQQSGTLSLLLHPYLSLH